MTDLSPAALAVLYATHKAMAEQQIALSGVPDYRQVAAAALRAAADQVISSVSPPCEDFDEYAQGFLAAHIKYRDEFLAIAAELEGAQ